MPKLTETHGVVGTLGDGEDVRRHLVPPLAAVEADSSHGVDREPLVRVDSDTEEAGVGVDQTLHVAGLQVEQHRGVVQVGQV